MPMLRKAPPLSCTAVLVLVATVGGCDYGTPATITPQQEQARVAFIADHADFSDRELAQLCPGLYPPRFLTDGDKYPDGKPDKGRKAPQVTAKDRTDAQAAGCDVRP
jgi:hypothetical protein